MTASNNRLQLRYNSLSTEGKVIEYLKNSSKCKNKVNLSSDIRRFLLYSRGVEICKKLSLLNQDELSGLLLERAFYFQKFFEMSKMSLDDNQSIIFKTSSDNIQTKRNSLVDTKSSNFQDPLHKKTEISSFLSL